MKDRRLDHRRLLDLHRRLRRRRQPGRPAQARPRAVLGRPRVGLGVAGEPAHPLQPRLGRPRRQAVERAQGLRLVGRGAGQVDRARRPGLRGRQAAVVPAAGGRRRTGRVWPATTRSSCRPTARAGCTRPPGCSTARCPTHYEPHESPVTQPALPAAGQPDPPGVQAHGQPVQPLRRRAGRRGLPVRLHDLPADRAPHGRRDEPLAAVPVRAAAGVLLRGLPRAGRASAGWSTAGWATIVTRPHRDRGAGAGHRPRRRPLHGGRPDDPPGRAALPLGRRQQAVVSGDSANDLFGVTLDPNVHIQETKVASCDIRPGRRPTGPALRRLVEDYRARAGITVETGNAQRTATAPGDRTPRAEGEPR